jgi:hypothetical protein
MATQRKVGLNTFPVPEGQAPPSNLKKGKSTACYQGSKPGKPTADTSAPSAMPFETINPAKPGGSARMYGGGGARKNPGAKPNTTPGKKGRV